MATDPIGQTLTNLLNDFRKFKLDLDEQSNNKDSPKDVGDKKWEVLKDRYSELKIRLSNLSPEEAHKYTNEYDELSKLKDTIDTFIKENNLTKKMYIDPDEKNTSNPKKIYIDTTHKDVDKGEKSKENTATKILGGIAIAAAGVIAAIIIGRPRN